MGHRANLLVISDVGTELYYSHWRASTLGRDLFWGPVHALRFIRQQRGEDEGAGWLDEVWAEGGALLDLRKEHLLFWGGENLCWDIPRRRVFLELMAEAWQGWSVEWAYEGIIDLARYAGVPLEQVLSRDDEHPPPALVSPEPRGFIDCALSIETGGQVSLYPLAGDADEQLWSCDELDAIARSTAGRRELDLGLWMDEFPTSGGHVDLDRREVHLWTAPDRPLIEERLAAANPGWTIRWHRDRYESQLEAAPGLRFPPIDRPAIVSDIAARLLGEDLDYSGYITGLIERLHPDDEVAINPLADRDDPLALGADERARIWQTALARWRATSDR